MIKKIIACLTICFIITGIISPVFSDASALPQPNWSDPGISEIISISDLTGWMINGGTFDVSQYTDAESFMNDYFNARTKTRLISPGEDAEDYYEVLPGFGINNQLVSGDNFANPLDTNRVIASSFRDHTGYGRRLSTEINDSLLSTGNLYNTKIPLLNEVEFANFVGYNHDALRLYSEFFDTDNPVPTPDPDPDYLSYINTINGSGFYWKNFPNASLYGFSNGGLRVYPPDVCSWISPSNYPIPSYVTDVTQICCSSGILNLYITSSNDIYSFNINIDPISQFYSNNTDTVTLGQVLNGYTAFMSNWNIGSFNLSYSGTLPQTFDYLTKHFRNVNIYVDGELWALTSIPVQPPSITPEFPDAVGGDDLPSTTWPIFRPRAPYYTNVPGMLQAIEDAIADDGKLDIDDLKPYLTDVNGDPVPDPQFDPEPVPIPVPDPVNPDIVPGLPVLPAIPLEMPGFNGVSVLAEIINFTNQSLPTALIVTFWGVVFGIVILGLIKILHK